MAFYYHEGLDRVTDGPDSAQANMAQSGWRKLSDEEAEDYQARQREELRALEESATSTVELNPSVTDKPVPDSPPPGEALASETPTGESTANATTIEKGN